MTTVDENLIQSKSSVSLCRFFWYCLLSVPFDIINVGSFGGSNETLTVLSIIKLLRFPMLATWSSQLNFSDR